MAAFSLRDNWGVGAAAGIAVSLCVGGWAYASMNHHRAGLSAAPIRPKAATVSTGAPATLDLAAGGAAKASTTAGAGVPPDTAALVVHVTGSVKKPGVYRLKTGDRINDAIVAAGGFKANARQDVLNLADTVRDADQIFVPSTAALAAKKSQSVASAGYSYAAPEAPRHALIVRGTPVRTARASVSAPQAASFDAPAANANDLADNSPIASEGGAEPPAAQPAPEATPGRVLGKPAPVEKGGEVVEEEDEPQAVPAPVPTSGPGAAPSAARATSTRKAAGSVSKSSGKSGSSAKFKNPGDGVVHLNRATAQELEKLPGVGPAMSARILEYRHQINGFRNIEQMLDVKGIGDKKFAKMRPFLAL